VLGNGWVKILNRQILGFCGFSKLQTTYIGPVRSLSNAARRAAIQRAKGMF
jgi:hypothetical protein